MDNKTNMQVNENPKEQLAREIAKNMSVKRRKNAFDEEEHLAVNNFNKNDFVKEPPSKTKIFVVGLLSFLIAFLVVFYIGGMIKFDGKFLSNTYINSGNFGGLTKDESVKLFESAQNRVVPEEISVTKKDGTVVKISSDKIGYSDNIEEQINEIYKKQNHYLWFVNLFGYDDYDMQVEYSFDFDKLRDECRRKIIDASANDVSKNAIILREGDSFVIEKEIQRTKVASNKEEMLLDYIENAIKDGNMSVDISNIDCYEQPEIVSSDLEMACAKLNKLKDCRFTFNFDYTKETLLGKDILNWITTDMQTKEEPFDVDYESVMKYVEESLAKKYDTYSEYNSRKFNSTSHGTMMIKQGKGCYGWWLDQEKTCKALTNAIKNVKSANIKPIYYTSTATGYEYACNPKWRTAKSDLGNTYIEIDLSKQHLWYYQNGKKKYSCDIVSGSKDKTPAGVYKLWQKAKNKTVDRTKSAYWANISSDGPVLYCDPGQKKFGKNIYKKSGTNGNIKLPAKAIKFIYEKVAKETPCIMYW